MHIYNAAEYIHLEEKKSVMEKTVVNIGYIIYNVKDI